MTNPRAFQSRVVRWLLLSVCVILLIGAGVLGWVEVQMRKGGGSYTEFVDTRGFEFSDAPFAIVGVSALSPDGQTMVSDQTVVVADGRIVSVETEGAVPEGVAVIDGTGRFLIPGLTDSHVHFRSNPNDLLLYLSNGVTSVREMAGDASILGWRAGAGYSGPAPRMYIASEKVSSKSGLAGRFERWTRKRLNYADPVAARRVIRGLKAEGYDALKVSSHQNREMYLATLRIASEEGLDVIGHIPAEVTLSEAITLGQREIAHVEELSKALILEYGGLDAENAEGFLDFVRSRAPAIAEALRSNDVAVGSTLWLMESLPRQKFALNDALQHVSLRHANPALVEGTALARGWLPGHNSYQLPSDVAEDPDAVARNRVYWAAYVEAIHTLVPYLVAEDVVLLAGTDANTALVVPGFSLHDELESLVAAGMTPTQALLSATSAPADWEGESRGRIQPEDAADLLLLTANPLERISNTRAIEAVVSAGRWIDAAQIGRMQSAVVEANDRSRRQSIDTFARPVQDAAVAPTSRTP